MRTPRRKKKERGNERERKNGAWQRNEEERKKRGRYSVLKNWNYTKRDGKPVRGEKVEAGQGHDPVLEVDHPEGQDLEKGRGKEKGLVFACI